MRATAESVLSSIDARYQDNLKELDQPTVRDGNDETMLHHSRELENLHPHSPLVNADNLTKPFISPKVRQLTMQRSIYQLGLYRKEFSHDPVVPKSLDFSVGQKSKSGLANSPQEALPDIAGYRVDRVLGRGGMGVVYLAQQLGIDRPVALKMIIGATLHRVPLWSDLRPKLVPLGKLQHENIVRIHDSGWHGNMPYFSLEFIDGISLSEKIAGKPLEPLEAATLATPSVKRLPMHTPRWHHPSRP